MAQKTEISDIKYMEKQAAKKGYSVNAKPGVVPVAPAPSVEVIQRSVIYKWTAPMRHFRKMDMKRYFTILAVVAAFIVLLVILGHYWLIAAILAMMFLLYAVGTVPPIDVEHILTTLGLETFNKEYKWADLDNYWISEKDGQKILNVNTKLRFPGRLIMLVSDADLQKINPILEERLKYKTMTTQGRINKIIDGAWLDVGGKQPEPKK